MKTKVYKYISLGDCSCYLGGSYTMNYKPKCYKCKEAYKFTVKKISKDNRTNFYIGKEVK